MNNKYSGNNFSHLIKGIIIWGSISLLLAGCDGFLGGGDDGGSDNGGGGFNIDVVDTISPTVTSATQVQNDTDVDLNTTISVDFSEAMDPGTLNSNTFTVSSDSGTTITGSVSYSSGTATFSSHTLLRAGIDYTATITTGASDLEGNYLDSDYSWDFTTGSTITCLPAQETEAADLVAAGKAALEYDMSATSGGSPFGQFVDNIASKFNQAVVTCGLNDEARFYSALFHIPGFLDGPVTTDFLNQLGMGSFREEDDKYQPFQPASDPIIGGIDSYVDMTFDEVVNFAGQELTENLAYSMELLAGISSSFTSTLNFTDSNGPNSVELDYTEVKILESLFGVMQAPFGVGNIWNYPGVDEFFSSNSTRDASTGEFINEITDAELAAFLKAGNDGTADSGDEPLSVNQTGVDQIKSLFSDIFSALSSGISNLLNETDTQNNDAIVLGSDWFSYDAQEDVERFNFSLMEMMASDVSASAGSATATNVSMYEAVATIADWDTCEPVAYDGIDPWVNNDGDWDWGTTITELTNAVTLIDVTSEVDNPGIIDLSTVHIDNAYYFKVSFPFPTNISIFTRVVTAGDWGDTSGEVGYSIDGDIVTNWDSDWGSGEDGNFGISIDATYSFPPIPWGEVPLDLIVRVDNWGPPVQLYILTDDINATAGVPIFLKGGGGRNFTISVEQTTVDLSLGAMMQVTGDFWDNSDRASLTLNTWPTDDVLDFDSALLTSEINKILPNATVTDSLGDPLNAFTNVFDSALGLEFDDPAFDISTDVTASFNPPVFCAYPYDLPSDDEFEGGYRID